MLVPANRFEVVECVAALQAVKERDLDGEPRGAGPLDVLCPHILIRACAGPLDPAELFNEVKSVGAYADLTRASFDDCFEFCATGGYALRAYDKWKRLLQRPDGRWILRDPRAAQRIRMNIGTIQDTDTLKVRLKRSRGGKPLGEVEESFAAMLTPGDTFLIGGQIVRYEGLREMTVEVTRRADKKPKVATFSGTKFATSTQLSQRILRLFQQDDWPQLPAHTAEWLALQRQVSHLPKPDHLLIESFPHEQRAHTVVYGFAGRNAQQTLGLLLSKRMEELGYDPLGFVATDYATLFWGLSPVSDPVALMDPEVLEQGLEQWLAGNALMKRTFRASATIAEQFEAREFSKAIRSIMTLADRANQYIDSNKPWELARDPDRLQDVHDVCSVGINLFRYLIAYLKPVIPETATKAESFLNIEFAWPQTGNVLLGHSINKFKPLITRIEEAQVEKMVEASQQNNPEAQTKNAPKAAAPAPAKKATVKAEPETSSDSSNEISIDDFFKVDLRVAEVTEANHVEGADKLLQLTLNVGDHTRNVFSGIKSAYTPEDLVGKLVVVVANLKPRKMRFGMSEGMVLAAAGDKGDEIFIVQIPGATPGMKVS